MDGAEKTKDAQMKLYWLNVSNALDRISDVRINHQLGMFTSFALCETSVCCTVCKFAYISKILAK